MTQATEIAALRNSRTISTEDLLFIVRKSKDKVFRLKEFLSWKEVRKNVKSSAASSSGPANQADAVADDDLGTTSFWRSCKCINALRHSFLGLEIMQVTEEIVAPVEIDENFEEYRQELVERLEVRQQRFI